MPHLSSVKTTHLDWKFLEHAFRGIVSVAFSMTCRQKSAVPLVVLMKASAFGASVVVVGRVAVYAEATFTALARKGKILGVLHDS